MNVKQCLSILFLGYSWVGFAQNAKPEPIFGSIVERKVQKDSTKKKSTFNPLKPAFLRIGVMGGGLVGYEGAATEIGGGTSGLRIEYGISNRLSLVGEISRNRYNGSTFTRGQASLGINWMPFKSKRLQPFFGLSAGAGGDGFGGGRGGRNGRDYYGYYFENNTYDNTVQGFANLRTGLNYVLLKKIIATVETGYQVPFKNNASNGGLSLRVGASYQFGQRVKKKKK